MYKEIIALGTHVVLKTIAQSAGAEERTESGILVGIRQTSEAPTIAEIHAIGPNVPKDLFKIGDKTPVPQGEKVFVPHPDVVSGVCKVKDRDEKFTSVDYRHISCVYK